MSHVADELTPRAVTQQTAPPPRIAPASWIAPAALFLGSLLIYGATINHQLLSLDVWSANYASWHLVHTGRPWIDGITIPSFVHNPLRHEWVLQAANGHTVIGRSPGVIAATLPAYWLTHASSMTTVPGGLTAALLTACSTTFMFLTLRRHLAERDALLAAAVFGFATPVWSVAANGMWPHTITILGIAGMAWAADRERWWLTGIFGGITLWGRLHAALIVAVLGLLLGWWRRDRRLVLRVGLTSGVFLAAMSVWTHWMYGTWNPTASYDTGPFAEYAEQHRFSIVNQLGFWIAPDRGILIWTPVILLLLPALGRSWRTLPDWSRALLYGGLAYTVLQGVLNRFSGGNTFYGYRLTLELLACATPCLAMSAPRLGRVARTLVGPVLGLQSFAIAVGSVKDGYYVSANEVWHHNAFLVIVRGVGAAGWVLVALSAMVGFLAQRVWVRRSDTSRGGRTSLT